MVRGGEALSQRHLATASLLVSTPRSNLRPRKPNTMEKEPDKVEALPTTDPYLGVPEDLEHTGKNQWSRLWPVIVSSN